MYVFPFLFQLPLFLYMTRTNLTSTAPKISMRTIRRFVHSLHTICPYHFFPFSPCNKRLLPFSLLSRISLLSSCFVASNGWMETGGGLHEGRGAFTVFFYENGGCTYCFLSSNATEGNLLAIYFYIYLFHSSLQYKLTFELFISFVYSESIIKCCYSQFNSSILSLVAYIVN